MAQVIRIGCSDALGGRLHAAHESTALLLALLLLLPVPVEAQEWIYTVRPGDNLWDLTEQHLTSMRYWLKLWALNQVEDPWHMPPGSRLRIPIAWLKRQPAAVRVVEVQGKAEAVLAATGETVSVSAGRLLRSGDEVRTGPDGSVSLKFADGSKLLLQADSRLVMDSLSAYGESGMVDTRMRLQQGRATSRVTPRHGSRYLRYEISTPAAVSAVRGTQYRVSAEVVQPVSRTEVLGGRVGVTGAGRTRVLPAGFGTVAQAGEPPQPPTRLLPAPDVSALPPVIHRVPIRLSVPPLKGATSYRTQIARTDEFRTLLFDGVSTSPRVRGPDLPDGGYVLRMHGIDARGLEGLDAYHRFTLDARPEPPFLVRPQNGEIVRGKPPTFQWAEPEGASAYHFQLAADDRFGATIVDAPAHTKSSLTPAAELAPGSYYWRVATRDTTGKQGPFGDPQGFVLKPIPPSPRLEAHMLKKHAVVFRWSAALPGQRYQFQIARDSEFEDIIFDITTPEPQVSVPRPEPGLYYLHIRTADVDGYLGPYGSSQSIRIPPYSYWPLAAMGIIVIVVLIL